jgi:hypothetical protein
MMSYMVAINIVHVEAALCWTGMYTCMYIHQASIEI